jgi:hypothetical protein
LKPANVDEHPASRLQGTPVRRSGSGNGTMFLAWITKWLETELTLEVSIKIDPVRFTDFQATKILKKLKTVGYCRKLIDKR